MVKIESISSKIRNKTRMPTLATFIQHSIGSSSQSNQTRKKNKRHPNQTGRSKTVTICRWHDITYKSPEDPIKKLLEPINEFSKFAGYKINIQKSDLQNGYHLKGRNKCWWGYGEIKTPVAWLMVECKMVIVTVENGVVVLHKIKSRIIISSRNSTSGYLKTVSQRDINTPRLTAALFHNG